MDDPRFCDLIKPLSLDSVKELFDIVILGFGNDEGVFRNGGRVGAAKGPEHFMKYVNRICASNSQKNFDFNTLKLGYGGIIDTLELEEAHKQLEQKVYSIITNNKSIPFVVGGGNDESYPNAKALLRYASENSKSVLVINLDAHLDVRPLKEGKVHSGSPFRLMLEDPLFQKCNGRFIEFASQGSQCSLNHVKYAKSKGVELVWLEDMLQNDEGIFLAFQRILQFAQEDLIFVSFDLDCIQASDAPGVSCSSPTGLSAKDALDICLCAGQDSRVHLFDLSEYNPSVEDYKTGRLTAMMFHSFITGYYSRINK